MTKYEQIVFDAFMKARETTRRPDKWVRRTDIADFLFLVYGGIDAHRLVDDYLPKLVEKGLIRCNSDILDWHDRYWNLCDPRDIVRMKLNAD